ncbi:unnamed protein product [Calypogeia fissa]
MKTSGEVVPLRSAPAFLGNESHRQGLSMGDFTGENFNQLKITAEKMIQEQACVKSDLQILKTKLRKSEDQVRTLESKVQDMNNENAMYKVKHKQDMKLWQGLDSKFLSTATFCDQLAETLKLLDCQVKEAETSKNDLENKLAERLEFFEHTESRLNDLLEKKKVAEDSVKQCEARNEELQSMVREMEQTLQSDSIKLETLAAEKDDLQQQLTNVERINDDNEAILRSNRCELQDLQKEVMSKAKEATDLQHLNLTLRQANGELELEVKSLQTILATTRKDNATLQQEVGMFKLEIADLENLNASSAANIEILHTEKAAFMQQSEKDKIAHEKAVYELKQYLVEHQLDVEVMKHKLQAAMKENERLVDVIGKEESKVAFLQDESKRLSQECTEKSQLISSISENESNLRRDNAMARQLLNFSFQEFMQEQLTAAENAAKSLEITFNLQLESQQKESTKHLEDVSHRHNQEIEDMRRKSERGIEEALATERLKGEDARRAAKKASDESMAKALEAFDQRSQRLQDDCERKITELREGHEKEQMKIVSIHTEVTRKQQEELHRANETIRNLREGQEQEKAKIISVHSDEVCKLEDELQNSKETVRKLQKGHEQETKRTVSIHTDEIQNKEVELQNAKKMISKLREGYEQEKAEIAASHAHEIHKIQEELRTEQETCNGNIGESHRKVEEIRKSNKEEMEELHHRYQAQLQKMTEEKSRLHQAMKEMQLTHDELLVKKTQEQKSQLEKLEKDQQAGFENVQNSLTRDLNKWRSKALGWEIQLKEALQQMKSRKGLKEDKRIQILNDFKMSVTEELVCKDIPTPVVTPMTKDKMPQQPNQRLMVGKTVDLGDTTDEDAEKESWKPAPQGKRHIQQSPKPGKRKLDAMSPSEEAPRMYRRTARKKGAPEVHDKIQQHQASTEWTKPTDVCSSGNKLASLMTKDNERPQQQLIKRQPSVEEPRRKTGYQQSDLYTMPGPTQQRVETRHGVLGKPLEQKKTAPKSRGRKSTKDVSQEKLELIKVPPNAPSPAISDLFEIDGILPYYKGDDPYAF